MLSRRLAATMTTASEITNGRISRPLDALSHHRSKRQRAYSIRLLVGTLCLFLCTPVSAAESQPQAFVNRVVVDGTINPAVVEFISESIQQSHDAGAGALVIQLDTPGGLLSSTRLIVKNILGAPLLRWGPEEKRSKASWARRWKISSPPMARRSRAAAGAM